MKTMFVMTNANHYAGAIYQSLPKSYKKSQRLQEQAEGLGRM